MDQDRPPPLGIASPADRNASSADVITAVEQVNGGDSLITVSTVTIHDSGRLGRFMEKAVLRLTPREREELIKHLMAHRLDDITATLNEPR